MRRLPTRPAEVVERNLTANSSENSVSSAAVSPDGKYLAYTDNTAFYLKLIRTGETHPVPLPPNFSAHVDDWFPDGSHLLVTREEEPGKLSLWSISVFGGSPVNWHMTVGQDQYRLTDLTSPSSALAMAERNGL